MCLFAYKARQYIWHKLIICLDKVNPYSLLYNIIYALFSHDINIHLHSVDLYRPKLSIYNTTPSYMTPEAKANTPTPGNKQKAELYYRRSLKPT